MTPLRFCPSLVRRRQIIDRGSAAAKQNTSQLQRFSLSLGNIYLGVFGCARSARIRNFGKLLAAVLTLLRYESLSDSSDMRSDGHFRQRSEN